MKLGGVDQAKEAYRDRATIPFLESLVQDLRFTIRQLRKNPAFTVTATAMVALGRRSGLAMGGRGTAGKVWTRVGSKLVVLELTTAMVLLVGAGLLGKSFYRLLQVDAGFETKHLIAVHVSAPPHCERSDYPVHPEKNPVNPVKPTCGPDLDRSFDRIYRIFFRMDRMDQNLWNISSDISVLTSNIL